MVPEDQLSIAIGKSGQNVRLASKLSGYEIDIEADRANEPVDEATPEAPVATATPTAEAAKPKAPPKLKKKTELENSLLEAIEEHGE